MTGRELKDWAAQVPDEATIETKEEGYSRWLEKFSLRATLQQEWDYYTNFEKSIDAAKKEGA